MVNVSDAENQAIVDRLRADQQALTALGVAGLAAWRASPTQRAEFDYEGRSCSARRAKNKRGERQLDIWFGETFIANLYVGLAELENSQKPTAPAPSPWPSSGGISAFGAPMGTPHDGPPPAPRARTPKADREPERRRRERPSGWRGKLQVNELGNPMSNFWNAHLALSEADEMRDVFGFDEMLRVVVLLKPIPGTNELNFRRRVLADVDVNMVQRWLQDFQQGMRVVTENTVMRAINAVAETNRGNPVHGYLVALNWDQKPRVENWLSYYCGVAPSVYAQQVGKMFLIGMVARIFQPGAQVDHMLILEGDQGIAKTSLCRVLAGEYFSESMPSNITSKDSAIHMRGKWLIELGELHVLSKADINELKKFLTKRVDIYRPPYGKNEVHQDRVVSFIGTTNQREYFNDETGARRFWPIWCEAIDIDALKSDRDQLFAEAVAMYRAGVHWWPTQEFQRQFATPQQDGRFVPDAWEDSIVAWSKTNSRATLIYIAKEALNVSAEKLGTAEQGRIRRVLTRLGWQRGPRGLSGERFYYSPDALAQAHGFTDAQSERDRTVTDASDMCANNVRQFPSR